MDGQPRKNQKTHFWKIIVGFILFSTLTLIDTSAAAAIMASGDAAVTAFSGTVNQNNNAMIDTNGPSVRVIKLPTSGPFGLRDAAKTLTVKAQDVGQVFGVALGNNGDIFVAATSAYGLGIVQPNSGGRIKKGMAGAQFIPGQFGAADSNGGPNSIWRIDGNTGKVTLFANVSYNGLPASPAALGGLAFDPVSKQLFVADRGTGMIHRFTLDGVDQGIYDHGQQGLQTAGLSPVAFDPTTLADITNAAFDTTNPGTWGYAPVERRVFAVAVYQSRLYYSVSGSHVWSVGIANNGDFASDTRLEVDISPVASGTEIASIAFDDQGYMYVAERGFPTGDYNFMKLANDGNSRVIRFKPKSPTDSSPAIWESPGNDYSIGMLPDYQNADGGVDLTCKPIVWSTDERLLDPGTNSNGFPHINGLQGNDRSLVQPANTPPEKSWFVNYYDTEANPESRGFMGAIAILRICEQPVTPVTPVTPPVVVTPPPVVTCPPGTYWVDNCCVPPPICPPGTYFRDGYCIYVDCPWGYVRINGECYPPPIYCPIGTVYIDGFCVPFGCPPPLILNSWGYCRCPFGTYFVNGHCIPVPICPINEIFVNGRCIPRWCPLNEVFINGRCVKRDCVLGEVFVNGSCIKRACTKGEVLLKGICVKKSMHVCPTGQYWFKGKCTKKPLHVCPTGQSWVNGKCVITPLHTCPTGQTWINGKCVKKPLNVCPTGQKWVNGKCVIIPLQTCPTGQIWINGKCVTRPVHVCPIGQYWFNGKCVKKPVKICPRGQALKNGICVKVTPTCPLGQVYKNGRCVPITPICPRGQIFKKGRCVNIITPTCPTGQVFRNGRCVSIGRTCPTGQVLRNGRCVNININIQKTCPSGYVYRRGHCVPITRPPTINVQPYTPNQPKQIERRINVYNPSQIKQRSPQSGTPY